LRRRPTRTLRQRSPALQRGLQVNLTFGGDTAAFLRVYQRGDVNESVLVLLNKGDAPRSVPVEGFLSAGRWQDMESGESLDVRAADPALVATVPAHGLRLLRFTGPTTNAALIEALDRQMAALPGE